MHNRLTELAWKVPRVLCNICFLEHSANLLLIYGCFVSHLRRDPLKFLGLGHSNNIFRFYSTIYFGWQK